MEGVWRVPTEKVLGTEQMDKVIGIMWAHDPAVGLAVSVAATTGLRLSEVYHLRATDILPDNMVRIVSRKKKVLQPEVIEVSEELHPFLVKQAEKVGGEGWLFPGDTTQCVIERRPQFAEEYCPVCKKNVADKSLFKKSSEKQRQQAAHLMEAHQWEMEAIKVWVVKVSESKREVPCGCNGGHISGRHIQMEWKMATAEAGCRMKGRGFHTTRHFAITKFIEENPGENPKTYQAYARHASLDMTMRYNHPRELGKRVRRMPAMAPKSTG